jgi:hypothetical protein
LPFASTSIQKQGPAGASQWGLVFEYFVVDAGIESSSGTDEGRARVSSRTAASWRAALRFQAQGLSDSSD